MFGRSNGQAFLKKGKLHFDVHADQSARRQHSQYELISDEEFTRRFLAFEPSNFLFCGYERECEELAKKNLPVPERIARHLERARVRRLQLSHPLALANMKLVIKVAATFSGRGVDFTDLVQEGYFALLHTIERFKIRLGYKFSTYATWWLRSAFRSAVMDISSVRILRVPPHRQEDERLLAREEASFMTLYGAHPTDEELLEYAKKRGSIFSGVNPKKLHALRIAPVMGRKTSLDTPFGNEGGGTFMGLFAAEVYSPETLAAARERLPFLEQEIHRIVDGSSTRNSQRDTHIFRWRFGIDDGEPKTLQEIGEHYHISRERVRQIVAKRLRDHGLSECAFELKLESLETIRTALGVEHP